MTLSLKNSEVRRFYEINLFAHAQCAVDAIQHVKNASKALDYLELFSEQFETLKLLYPTATQDIRAIEKLQSDLCGRVQLLIQKSAGIEIEDFVFIDAPSKEESRSSSSLQPVGIVRKMGQQNCAYGSLLQAISNTSNLRERFMTDFSPYRGFYEEYAASQDLGRKVSDIDLNDVRKLTSPRGSHHQEDAGNQLGLMLEMVTPSKEIVSYDDGKNLYTKYGSDTLSIQFQTMDNFRSNVQESLAYVGGIPPNSLIVNRTNFGFEGTRITLDREVPTHIPHRKTGYDLTGCVIQLGGNQGGHFVTLQKKPDGWYLIDDHVVRKVNDREAQNLLKKGYLYFYEKTGGTPAPGMRSASEALDDAQPIKRQKQEVSSSGIEIPAWSLTLIGLIALAGSAYAGLV